MASNTDPNNQAQGNPTVLPRRNRAREYMRAAAGFCLLIGLAIWATRDEPLLAQLTTALIAGSALLSAAVIGLNALTLTTIVSAYQQRLDYRNALRLSALGAFGNALGGLPLGTALKFALLYRRAGLTARQLVTGLAVFTLATSAALLAYAAFGALQTRLSTISWALPLGLLIALILAIGIGLNSPLAGLLRAIGGPFLSRNTLPRVLWLSGAVATLFVITYCFVGRQLFAHIPLPELVFIGSAGILVSFGSLLQSVGGVQELAVGLTTSLTGAAVVSGVKMALVARLGSVISSGFLLGAVLLWPAAAARERQI